jgi:small-conductance mechanosensitive channel
MTAKDKRPTLTVKGEAFTPEFRAKLNKAARRRGQTQAQFVAEVLEQAATRVLTGKAEDTAPEAPTPALVERMAATDAAIAAQAKRMQTTEEKLEHIASQLEALTEAQRKSFWERMFGR